jgi:hypothetical protein
MSENTYLCSVRKKDQKTAAYNRIIMSHPKQQEEQEQAIARLREMIEGVVERKMKTPKDFDFLSECIFEQFHETISPTTLKRFWGYLPESGSPRTSTLDILSSFVGYANWKDFCKKKPIEKVEEKGKKKRLNPAILVALIALLLLAIAGVSYQVYGKLSHKNSIYTLKIGDSFSSPHEYLKLFGINAKEKLWGQILPHHPNISVWGPEYHHFEWHNEGDKSKMMQTITEYWKPEGVDSVMIVQRNIDQFNHCSRLNEIRITFMKNLVDTNYVFLGVYRMSLELSDTTKCVWERVADKCDLNNLDYLEELRN